MRTVAQFHVGIDLHQRVIQTCVMDLKTGEMIERRFRVSGLVEGLGVVDYLAGWKERARYVVEAVGMNRWFVNACRERGMDVVVADPAKLNLKMLGKKTDRHDAQELARRLGLGDIDRKAQTYYPSEAEYGARKVLRVRHELKGIRQRVVNQLRAMFRAYWVEAPAGRLYTKKGLGWLEGCEMENEELTRCVRALGRLLEKVEAEIADLTERARELSRETWPRELDAIPQVGALTAVTLANELGDVERFGRTRMAAAVAGLAPRVSDSADRSHHGPVTKRGNVPTVDPGADGSAVAGRRSGGEDVGGPDGATNAPEQGAHGAGATARGGDLRGATARRAVLDGAMSGCVKAA